MADKATAERIIKLLELTSLNDNDDEKAIIKLCQQATGSFGHVAAVCVLPRFIKLCQNELNNKKIRIATVVNYPFGSTNIDAVVEDTKQAILNGADEINLVFPYKAFLNGDTHTAKKMISACKKITRKKATLKVVLETGVLEKTLRITDACSCSINAGADFIMTSTGKTSVSATCEAANAIMEKLRDSGSSTGFAASGGINTIEKAKDYLSLADLIMGIRWASPDTFRFSDNNLLNDLKTIN
ncbi:MAG: deoxyribose-phosphate aldolase [Alphaproteobacteria bacterium]|nr:deoxyribose-phosphate aldolase [Alphaproteobacteria bacterium]